MTTPSKIKDHLHGYNPIPDYRCVRELKFPRIPESVIGEIEKDTSLYKSNWDWTDLPDAPLYADQSDVVKFSYSYTEAIAEWCNLHICDSVRWEWQLLQKDIPKHMDFDADGLHDAIVHTKFLYLVTLGGNNVRTEFYDDMDSADSREKYILKPHTWYLFNTINVHSVTGIDPGQTRFTIIGNTF
jgi:hypothetical protein